MLEYRKQLSSMPGQTGAFYPTDHWFDSGTGSETGSIQKATVDLRLMTTTWPT
jgi:hypothetical protein